jgi:osmotically-inducible protein OsmY
MGVLALACGLGVGCTDKDDDKVDDRVERKAKDAERAADHATDKVDQAWDHAKADVKATADDVKRVDVDVDEHAADNTGVNERDRADGAKTADQADMAGSDVDVMAKIRSRVVDDDTLSTNAHNVKIIAEDGVVTLKGPVASAAEKARIEDLAVAVVGRKNVRNLIDIAP